MEVRKAVNQQEVTLTPVGMINTQSAPDFSTELMAAVDEYSKIILDFTELIYISSAGLRVILQGVNAGEDQNKEIEIIHANDEIKEVFELTGFSDFITVA
ncbi:MAG: STAS domain-containing protein [bacterium]|nr:STAS domain-containing protein [bacterium]